MTRAIFDRNGRTIAVSATFGLILVSAVYAVSSGDPGASGVARSLIFGGAVVLGLDGASRNRSSSWILLGSALLVVGGFAGVYAEVNGTNGFERPIVASLLLVGIVLARHPGFSDR